MFSQEQLQELLSYEANGHQIVSLYLDTDSGKNSKDAIKLTARGLLREAAPEHEANTKTIEQFLNHGYDWSQPGLAIFASRDGDFFRAYPAAVSFRNRIRFGHKPYVKPLAHLLDHYAHYGVILVDRVGARFFEYHLGNLKATEGTAGEDVHKVKQGQGSTAVGMRGGMGGGRHEEEVAQRNLRDSAAAAGDFFSRRPIRRLFLGGTSETVAQFSDLLPKKLQSCLTGSFAIDMTAAEHEVRSESLTQLTAANTVREQKLVEKMLATAKIPEGTAVIGLDDTLQAISNKRVETLIISDGYHTPGYVHEDSGYVVANLALSPLSDRELTAVADVVDAAVAQTLNQGGRIEVINDSPGLEGAGRIGALLRY